MKTLLIAAALAGLSVAAGAQSETPAAPAAGAPSAGPLKSEPIAVSEVELTGEVVKVDKSAKTVTLKDPAGQRIKLNVPADVTTLDNVKTGNVMDVKYISAVAVSVSKPGAAAPSAAEENVRLAPRGGTPAETLARTRRMSGTVLDFDKSRREITVKGPEAAKMTLTLPDNFMDWDSLKVGDTLGIQYTDAVALSATKREDESAGSRDFSRSSTERPAGDRTGTDTRRPGSDPMYQQRNEPLQAPGRDQTPANQQPSQAPNTPR
jgi:hypothetical protein